MKNKQWKQFDLLTEKCYGNMIGAYKDSTCWQKAFQTLCEIVKDERCNNPDFPEKLYELDDSTDFAYDIQGWLEDYLDEMDMAEQFNILLDSINTLLELFQWDEGDLADLYFRKASVLGSLNRADEASDFCQNWLKTFPDSIPAITANVYAQLGIKNIDHAKQLVENNINSDTECTEDNDILFTAASFLYQISGDKTKKAAIDKKLQAYEDFLSNYYGCDDEDMDFDWSDEDLPF